MTLAQAYLLGALGMALRTLWATRPETCPVTGVLVKPTIIVLDDGQEHDIRYLITALFAMTWPLLLAVWIYVKLVMKPGDEDDLRSE